MSAILSVTPAICYRDPNAAIDWLQAAFGFEIGILLTDADGRIAHCELRAGEHGVGVMGEWSTHKSAPSLDGATTHLVQIHLDDGIDEHFERARAAGARIIDPLEEQFYGDRTYRCADPEGNVWRFGQRVREVSREEMERVSGLRVHAL